MSASAGMSPLLAAFAGGMAAAAATALGAIPAWYARHISRRMQDTLLGMGAGVMLAASSFSLILPGLAAARAAGFGKWGAGWLVAIAIGLGAVLVWSLDRLVPHEHFIKGAEGRSPQRLKRVWLFVFAICLHNLPEGLAIGVGYANGIASGNVLTTGIALQDIPEGLVVAVALTGAGYRRGLAVGIGAASGLLEPLGALLGAGLVVAMPFLLPAGLGFAAGAMLYVVSHEVIPESHRQGHENWATAGLMGGFVLMMLLDTALG